MKIATATINVHLLSHANDFSKQRTCSPGFVRAPVKIFMKVVLSGLKSRNSVIVPYQMNEEDNYRKKHKETENRKQNTD